MAAAGVVPVVSTDLPINVSTKLTAGTPSGGGADVGITATCD